jgi:hypothetical protein
LLAFSAASLVLSALVYIAFAMAVHGDPTGVFVGGADSLTEGLTLYYRVVVVLCAGFLALVRPRLAPLTAPLFVVPHALGCLVVDIVSLARQGSGHLFWLPIIWPLGVILGIVPWAAVGAVLGAGIGLAAGAIGRQTGR